MTGAWLRVDLGVVHYLDRVDYLPRQDSENGRYNSYMLFISNTKGPDSARLSPEDANGHWGDPVAEGNWPNNTTLQTLTFDWTNGVGRYVILYAPDHGYGTTANAVKELTIYGGTIALADSQTGSRLVTNSNTVDVAAFYIPPGYDEYQINQITDVNSLPGPWISTNTQPATATFTVPNPEDEVFVQAWFNDSSATLPVTNLTTSITYVKDTADVAAVAQATFSRPSWGAAWPAVIHLANIENGSSSSIGIYSYAISAPEDQTPGDPHTVTLVDPGDYTVTLTVTDNAGNTATDTTVVTITAGPSPQVTAWTGGAGNTDWFNHDNWSNFSPGPGADATIDTTSGQNVTLNASTAPMSSFTMAGNRTLTFSGWETTLTATNVTINGGTLTHPLQSALEPVDNVWVPDNRIRIVASNVSINTDINLSARGFREGSASGAAGKGPGGGADQGGGGYGGRGGRTTGGLPYGDAQDPQEWPGSGGANRGHAGGHGGGLFVLEADGHVILNGTINVNGSDPLSQSHWGGGGGSGGGIVIRAGTLAATNAVLTANGGNGGTFASGSGGGGRISIEIGDTESQDALPVPGMRVTVNRGPISGPNGANTLLGDFGTIWVNHSSLLPPVITNTYGYLHGPAVTHITSSSLALTNSWIQLVGNETLDITGDMSLSGATLLGLRATGVGGDIVMDNTSTLSFHGIPTNGLPNHLTTHVAVSNEFHIGANGTVFVHSDPQTGGSPYFEVDRLYLADTATINADQRGYGGGPVTTGGYGPGTTADGYGGASHGGLGGRHPTYGGTTYGSETEPAEPGSGGAGRSAGIGRTGGGLIHITAADTMALHGSVTANGGAAASNIGASSGGGIYLWADIFAPAEGTISAVGGAGTGSGGTAYGGGGGGRIARLFRGDGFAGTISAAGGTGNAPGTIGSLHEDFYDDFITLTIEGDPARRGQPAPLDSGNHGVVAGSVVNNSVTSPTEGVDGIRYRCLGWHYEDETGVTDSGTGTAFSRTINTNATLTWQWTNEYYLATSAAAGGSLQTDRTGWYTEGDTTSLTPVADSGRTFTQWSGDYAPESLTATPLPILMDGPRTIRANFGVSGGTARTWIGDAGNWMDPDLWDPAGVPGPGDAVSITNGTVTLAVEILGIGSLTVNTPGTLTVVDTPLQVTQSMLIDGSGLGATFTRSDLTVGGHLELRNSADLRVNSAVADSEGPEYGTRVAVGGDLTIGSGSWVFPHSDLYENGSTCFQVGNLYVASGGGFNADFRGYRGGLSQIQSGGSATVGWGPGSGNLGRGAGYGGLGGGAVAPYGQIYGVEERPIEAGSGGGGDSGGASNRAGGYGGGLIWVEAERIIRLDGTMTANGQIGQGDYGSGGGSGGGIYLYCLRFEGDGGILRANGGSGHNGTSGTSGGGGRIAVWRVRHTFTGPEPTVTVGTPLGSPPAGEGTVFWGDIPPPGTIMMIR